MASSRSRFLADTADTFADIADTPERDLAAQHIVDGSHMSDGGDTMHSMRAFVHRDTTTRRTALPLVHPVSYPYPYSYSLAVEHAEEQEKKRRKRLCILASAVIALLTATVLIIVLTIRLTGNSNSSSSASSASPASGNGPGSSNPSPYSSSLTWGGSNSRNKVYSDTGLTPDFVSSASFGRRATVELPLSLARVVNGVDSVYAQPIVFSVNGTEYVFIASTGNNVHVVDGLKAQLVASKNFGSPHRILQDSTFIQAQQLKDSSASVPFTGVCREVSDFVGIVGTPVIDPTSNTAYFFSISVRSGASPSQRTMSFHAVDAISLVERPGFPVIIAPTADNNPTLKFDPNITFQRSALLLSKGIVYATFGGHCQLNQGAAGWLIGVNIISGAITSAWVTRGSAIFAFGGGQMGMGGAGIALDEQGNLHVTTGTGLDAASLDSNFPSPATGSTIPNVLNQAYIKLKVTENNKLIPIEYFMPSNYKTLDQQRLDFGAGGPVLLPSDFKGPSGEKLSVTIDAAGRIIVQSRDSLGGFQQGPSLSDRVVSMFDLGQYVTRTQSQKVVFSVTPVAWVSKEGHGYLYVSCKTSNLFVLAWNSTSFQFTPAGQTVFQFTQSTALVNSDPGMPTVTPTANGAAALVWVLDVFQGLYAVNAVPSTGRDAILSTAYHDDAFVGNLVGQGSMAGFSLKGSGLVYVATKNATLLVYGKVLM
ncbi:hypothetical protein BJ741DRAFT_706521 [Chytriomyces cf. hyalinus JEL632]|nr:hypothetical protein BJ741DRAFT_706521 [Chytriomyces cf. hyalinus JEL632]